MRRSSGWFRMVGLFAIAGLCEVCAYGQVTAFTPLHLPDLGVASGDVAFWVGAITAISSVAGLPFLPFWGALADRYGRKPLIIRSFVSAFIALTLAAVAPNIAVFLFARAFQSLGLGNTGLMLATLAERVPAGRVDRKSTRLNSSHRTISYAVFCLKKKKLKYKMKITND